VYSFSYVSITYHHNTGGLTPVRETWHYTIAPRTGRRKLAGCMGGKQFNLKTENIGKLYQKSWLKKVWKPYYGPFLLAVHQIDFIIFPEVWTLDKSYVGEFNL